ncbi:MAG: glycogen-debranching protein [Fibrobacteres bacterium]|nr:glycogen-debranching protein [Fibrobacterota bacterium]
MRLGPLVQEDGVEFRLLAPDASRVELCVFLASADREPYARVSAAQSRDGIWRAFAPGTGVGCLYAWSVDGSREVALARFDPTRLLLDPAGWQIERPVASGGMPPMSRVVEPGFDWQGVARPRIDADRRVIYEAHVKGLTRLHPGLPGHLRGTYAGLASPQVVDHLVSLGVTTLELLPIHAHLDDHFLVERGLVNYWGYSTLSWFAPQPSLAARPERAVDEFRAMVRTLHAAGIEVVLDVVYNHSCEAGPDGHVHGLRGVGSWYRQDPSNPSHHQDYTGCGNTLDFRLEHVRAFVLESLRHWVRLGVDGFRFDLASVHGRMESGFDPEAPFFSEVAADPELSGRLMIAEPWDATMEGYGLGKYPRGWAEWNDRFRDDVRLFWKGEATPRAFGTRLAGSPDLYPQRGPAASINYVACHDGFTLRDLATYAHKHNEANGEGNRDGGFWNHSDNLGHEGETSDTAVIAARARRVRNLLACALLARGTPMLLAGDEMGRTQQGNNNAYCQDNEISWVDWLNVGPWPDAKWVKSVVGLRAGLPPGNDWSWIEEPSEDGPTAAFVFSSPDRSRAILANRSGSARSVALPVGNWQVLLDTCLDDSSAGSMARGNILVSACSLVVLDRI